MKPKIPPLAPNPEIDQTASEKSIVEARDHSMQPNFSYADFVVWLEQSGTTVLSEKVQNESFDDDASKLQQIF